MRLHLPRPLAGTPSVSVVVPCYNYGRFLPTAVSSALDQEGVAVEVIVVDDASTDDSAEVARGLTADPRVRLLEHERNQGHIATYNDGLAKASGDYVVLLSADDALPRDALTRAIALMEARPRVGLVYGYPQNFVDKPPVEHGRARSWSVWSGGEWLRTVCRTGGNPILSPEVVLRRRAWEQAGPYDAELPHAADFVLWLITATRWDVARVNGPPQALYRVHGDNMHLTRFTGMLVDLEQRWRCFEKALGGSEAPPDGPLLLDRARRALARETREVMADARLSDNERAAFVDLLTRLDPSGPPQPSRRSFGRRMVPPAIAVAARRTRRSAAWHLSRRYGP